MAAFDFSESFTSLIKFFTCSICNKLYENPVDLNTCSDVFCLECINNIENCPTCNSSIIPSLIKTKESTRVNVDKIKKLQKLYEASETKYRIENLPLNLLDVTKGGINLTENGVNSINGSLSSAETDTITQFSNLNNDKSFVCHEIGMNEICVVTAPSRRNHKGETPLHVACHKRDIIKVTALVNSGIDINIKDFGNWTPLHDAVHKNAYDCVEKLLNSGALVNAPGENYITPLYQAVDLNYPILCQLLISYGATINCEDYFGKNILFVETINLDRWPLDMKDAYLKVFPDADVVLVDWTFYSNRNLFSASCNAPLVGEEIGNFFVDLEKSDKIDFKNTHIVAFSLGAQVAGFIGQEVKNKTGRLLSKITGLDVVGPGFEDKPKDQRLSSDDAEDVIVVHSSYLGTRKALGRIDFYLNGGLLQTNCIFNLFKPTLSIVENAKKLFCSHYKSPKFKIMSLGGYKFVGYQCPSLKFKSCMNNEKVIFEEDIDRKYKGIFYVDANV